MPTPTTDRPGPHDGTEGGTGSGAAGAPPPAGPPPPSPGSGGVRSWLYETIFEHDTRPGLLFDVLLLIVIALSIVVVMLESVQGYQVSHGPKLRIAEWVLTGIFTVEYVTRLACHPRPAVYARSFFGVVDVLSLAPTYIAAIFPGAQALVVVRMLRLIRVFRVLKLGHFVRQADELTIALRASMHKIIVFMISVVILTTISGSIMYLIEGSEHGYDNIPKSVYWAIVTLTTVGYGDITPETPLGQFVSAILMIMGYGVIAVPTGIVSAELARSSPKSAVSGKVCTGCGLDGHQSDAVFCKRCGAHLHH
ncbi:MAG: voltage-gated potassium channel [Planctomycetota bacterium]|jgi:voltage-gated potassium channel